MTTLDTTPEAVGQLLVVPLLHPQGCRSYLVADPASMQALAIDVHLDLVEDVVHLVNDRGWTLPYVVDTHTHADHPSGAGAIAKRFGSTRIAHEKAQHAGVTRHPADGDVLHLGDRTITVQHAPGHTPDHMVLITDAAVFSGDSILIGGVARADFLGGDAGQLFDSVHRLLDELGDDTLLYPGHDYKGRVHSTIGDERANNPWLALRDRDEFVRQLRANPPARPANMDALLKLNREGVAIADKVTAQQTIAHVDAGGATTVLDVRTGAEFDAEHIDGSRLVPLDQIRDRVDEIRQMPAPRLILCRSGARAAMARKTLTELHVSGTSVVEGGIEAYRAAGGKTEKGRDVISLERQVRIVAGALVFVGALLAAFVHGAFLILPAFVGAGLVFAGVTDTCGMGILLGKMPWNRSKSSSASGGPASACAAGAPSACAAGAPPTSACSAGDPE